MSKSDPSNNKAKPKTYRLTKPILEGILLVKETEGCTETKAVEDLLSLGITVWLQKVYKDED